MIQETHLSDSEHLNLKQINWSDSFLIFSKCSRGVAIIIDKKIPFRVTDNIMNKFGRYIIIKGTLNGKEISILN